uniref:Zinc ion binding protein n=1 Tax=Solanum tuberosum TaxID=4113 RepID=M1B7P5_SOLTU
MAEEHEIEEGEIYDDSHIDIDAKIQTVLGDYMKDFEGAVSAENLGPKYGVYGSFMPIDQLVIQPQISQKLPSPTPISSHKPIRIRIKLRSGNTAAPKSSDLHTASHCPELTTSGDESPLAPFIIQEDWIRCSTCRKRRLLPYGTKPDQLSQSWVCTMLDWLPGMNCCDISEDDTTSALHALYQSLIQSNFQNRGAKGTSIDLKAHNGREVSVKKRKSREQDYLGNELGESDANAFEGKFRKQKKSKVIQTEKKKSSRSKGEGKSTRRDRGIKDSAPIEREQQANKYGVKQQSQAECGMTRKPVYKKAIGYGKVARAYIAFW